MPFTDIAPPEVATSIGTGISLSLRHNKRSSIARINLNAKAQEKYFGGPVDGKKFYAKVGRGSDEGRLLIYMSDDGDLTAKASMKGSAFICMKAWDLLPKSKPPAASCDFISKGPEGVMIKLPSWAKPSGVGGKMESEFGLKRQTAATSGG